MNNQDLQIKNLRTQLERQKGQQLQIEKTIKSVRSGLKPSNNSHFISLILPPWH